MSQANPFRGHAVILGAGASKGASVGGISPPRLMRSFWTPRTACCRGEAEAMTQAGRGANS